MSLLRMSPNFPRSSDLILLLLLASSSPPTYGQSPCSVCNFVSEALLTRLGAEEERQGQEAVIRASIKALREKSWKYL